MLHCMYLTFFTLLCLFDLGFFSGKKLFRRVIIFSHANPRSIMCFPLVAKSASFVKAGELPAIIIYLDHKVLDREMSIF